MHLLEIDESIAVGVIPVQACLVVLLEGQGKKDLLLEDIDPVLQTSSIARISGLVHNGPSKIVCK